MQTIIFGRTGQTISLVPPARVASAAYVIEDLTKPDDAANRVLASGTANAPAWTITSSAAAGRGQRNAAKISTASTTGPSVNARASIVAPDGTREVFRIARVSTNSYIEAETGLVGVFPTGSTVYGIEISANVPDSLVSNSAWTLASPVWDRPEDILEQRRPLRVVWTFTLDGVTYHTQSPLAFVRHTASVVADVGEVLTEIRTLYPDMPERLAEGGNLDAITLLLADKIANDLRRAGREPERFMMGQQGRDLLVARVLALAAQHGYAPGRLLADAEWRAETRRAYQDLFDAMTIGLPGQGVIQTEHVSDMTTEQPTQEMWGPTFKY